MPSQREYFALACRRYVNRSDRLACSWPATAARVLVEPLREVEPLEDQLGRGRERRRTLGAGQLAGRGPQARVAASAST